MPDNKIDKNTISDYSAALARGILGAIPTVGSLISEVVTNIIPHQRSDRLADFLQQLEKRVAKCEDLQTRLNKAEYVDLFEEGCWQSARALSENRRGCIAAIIAKGILSDISEFAKHKTRLNILRELSDLDIFILKGYDELYTLDDSYILNNAELSKLFENKNKPNEYGFILGSAISNLERWNLIFINGRGNFFSYDVKCPDGPLKGRVQEEITAFGRVFIKEILG